MTNEKAYKSGDELIDNLSAGCEKLASNVGSTMGPKGRNVILRPNEEEPVITKDGVTVANFVDLENHFQDLGAQIIKQSAIETNKKAGDGTTTSTVIANSIFQNSVKYLLSDTVAPKNIKKGIRKLKQQIVDYLEENSRPIMSKEDVEHIATISSNGDESIGDMISLAVDRVGKDGSVIVEESGKVETELEFVEGFQFGAGFVSSKFINDERNKKVYYDDKEPLILVTDHKIDDVSDMYGVLKQASQDGRPLVLVAQEVQGQALAALIANAVRGTMDIAAIRAPFYGEKRRKFLEDLAINVNARFVSGEAGDQLSNINMDDLGACDSVEITQNQTTIVGGKGNKEDIQMRIEGLKNQAEREEDLKKAEEIHDRVARLSSGVALIKVGASTKVDLNEKKHRVEDALEAVKSAQEEGVLPGGGVTLLRAAQELDTDDLEGEEKVGAQILKKALESPVRRMSDNAGAKADIVIQKVLNEDRLNYGFDFMKGEMTDLYEAGIIDPTKVTRTSFENALSSASTLLMSSNAVVEKDLNN